MTAPTRWLLIVSALLTLSAGPAAAQTLSCTATDVAVTAVITDANDTAGRTALAGDCATLLDLKDTLRGTATLDWATNLSMTSWEGITVTGSRVTTLHLGSKLLSGSIPAALGSLTSLQTLRLNTNQLSGPIPAALGSLTSLVVLHLDTNQLSGPIPAALGSLTSLQQLHLQRNQLSGSIPAALGSLTSLQDFSLHTNQLSGPIPAALGSLTSLLVLELYSNELSGRIPDLSALTSLQLLTLQRNQLSGSIPDLSALTSLQSLYLNGNQLSGSIPDLSALSGLGLLVLSDNQLSGPINASHFPPTLRFLYLHRNELSGSIPDLSALTNLRQLMLHQNQLSGAIPATLGSLSSLQRLLLAGNPLTGGIPDALGSLSSLTWLSLCGTNLAATATLPPALETRRTDETLTVWSCVRIEDASAVEGTTLSFAVEHSTYPVRGVAGATGGLTLTYETADDTATSADYTGTSMGSVTIPANTDPLTTSSSAPLSVPTTADSVAEADETLTVTLAGWPSSGVHPLKRTATGTIQNKSSGGGGGGGGGGGATVRDTHGNTPRRATAIRLTPRRLTRTRSGFLVSRIDIDYFKLDLPQPGILIVESRGSLNTRGRLFDAEETLLAEDDDSGRGRNFRLATAVPKGVHYVAVDSPSRRTGAYTLAIDYRPGYLEIPGAESAQSGIGLVSGWVCEAETVIIEFETAGVVQETEAVYGTARVDTEAVCGAADTGFGLLLNWNNLGAGDHTVRAVVDGVVLAEHAVTVTTLGEEFRRGLSGQFPLADFPQAGERTQVVWVEGQQNFMLAEGEAPPGAGDTAGPYPHLQFENPGAGTYQSGVGVISGWVCEAEEVEVVFTAADGTEWRAEAAYGTERLDTQEPCGDVDNGFGLLFNWNHLGDGEQVVELLVDGEVVAQSTIRVTTLGEEFVRGISGVYDLAGFPTSEEITTIEWQQAQQNFVITGVE